MLQVRTQEALFHMHFYIRPITAMTSTEPFIIALPLLRYHWRYVKKCLHYKAENIICKLAKIKAKKVYVFKVHFNIHVKLSYLNNLEFDLGIQVLLLYFFNIA